MNNYIVIDGKKIEALDNGSVCVDGKRVEEVEELEYVLNVIIKSVIALVR